MEFTEQFKLSDDRYSLRLANNDGAETSDGFEGDTIEIPNDFIVVLDGNNEVAMAADQSSHTRILRE